MKITLFFVLIIILISFMNTYVLDAQVLSQNIVIQGTHYGGCGFAFITKRNVLDTIKKHLLLNVSKDMNIEIKMKNYKTESDQAENYVTLDTSFNETEYNVFIIANKKRKLLGSSDNNDPNFYEYLVDSNRDKEEFLKSITEKIINFMKNQVDI